MNADKVIKVTLVYHPHKAMGKKYEVVKIVGAVYVNIKDPKLSLRMMPVRVSDCLDEDEAVILGESVEVTVLPEK